MAWSQIGNLRGPAGPTGPAGTSGITVYETTADQPILSTSLTDIAGWTVPLPANGVVTLDAQLWFHSAALTTGFQFAVTPKTAAGGALTPTRFCAVLEYQTSATAKAVFTQTVPTTPMTLTTASYVANSAILCEIRAQIECGATGGNLFIQARTEVSGSAITIRRGNVLRVM